MVPHEPLLELRLDDARDVPYTQLLEIDAIPGKP